jgi:phage terminase Nu1 subunit (DNA packaging protein)
LQGFLERVMDGGVAPAVTVNKKELARLLDVSLPTLDKMIEDHADFPVEQRGTNGCEWQFDPARVKAWSDAQKAKADADYQARMQALGRLDFEGATRKGGATDAHAQLALTRAERERRKLMQEAGLLIDVASLRATQAPVVQDLVVFLDGLADQIGRRFALAPGTIEDMRAMIEHGRNKFLEGMDAALGGDVEDTDDLGIAAN